MTRLVKPNSLAEGAYCALIACELDEKVQLTNEMAAAWEDRQLSLTGSKRLKAPDRPGRPDKPDLLPALEVRMRPLTTTKGRLALIHAIAHIELNAIDLALDIIVRFAHEKMPPIIF